MGSVEEVLKSVAEKGVRFIELQFTDMLGIVKSVTIPSGMLEQVFEHGVWFDGSSIEGFARIAESDMYLKPDPDTFAIIPWSSPENLTARLICDVYTPDGKPFEGDPRYVLKKALKEAREMGFGYYTGPEPEFFLLKADQASQPHDRGGYFDFSTDEGIEVRKEMAKALEAFGIEVEAAHHEVAFGQHEIDFRYADALKTADNVVTFKFTLKRIARKHGLYATFMPKPFYGINGSGMHTHQSLYSIETGKNMFADPNADYGLSDIALKFIAGQLKHARGMCSVLAPLVNSYKRLTPGYEAPVYISWGTLNRSALIRIPKVSPNRLESTRIELRCPDPSCNPYLAFAIMLRAGLDGIKKDLTPPDPVEEDIYHLDESGRIQLNIGELPQNLYEAIQASEEDPLIRETLGDYLFERYIAAKKQEWREYSLNISNWEIERYLWVY